MDPLYSSVPAEREAEAKKYRVFHKNVRIPRKWRDDWNELLQGRELKEGRPWPDSLLRLMRSRRWPGYTFGTVNASCLVVLHRPGDTSRNRVEDTFIEPDLPVLGGIPHAHNCFWYDRYNKGQTWKALHRYLPPAFKELENPWSQIMTTNLTTVLASAGQVDPRSNLDAVNGGLLDFLVALCKPRIILLCGGDVHKATRKWSRPQNIEVIPCKHPSFQHWSGEGDRVQRAIRETLFS